MVKRYHKLYKDDDEVIINPNNLEWMDGNNEAELPNIVDVTQVFKSEMEEKCLPTSVSTLQTGSDINKTDGEMEYYSAHTDKTSVFHGQDEKHMVDELKFCVSKSGYNIPSMDFPQVKEEPINEYDGTSIFVGAFPWLFRGGIGDVYDDTRGLIKRVDKWMSHLMHYRDHRFENDKLFVFFVNDYYQRKSANSNGGYFVKTICYRPPETLNDLKRQISNKDFSFVRKLQYFCAKMKGSDSYWRQKRHELTSWINYHIEQKNGPPTLFITLSCAENWWPDLQRLIDDRLKQNSLTLSKEQRLKESDRQSGLVQLFFHKRFQAWMDTVGKKILKIKHYWAAIEFAAGRGQIHTHLLAITSDQMPRLNEYYSLRYHKDGQLKRTELIANYARTILGMTSNHPGISENIDEINLNDIAPPQGFASRETYSKALLRQHCEISDEETDQKELCNCCQIHGCNPFCMKYKIGSTK